MSHPSVQTIIPAHFTNTSHDIVDGDDVLCDPPGPHIRPHARETAFTVADGDLSRVMTSSSCFRLICRGGGACIERAVMCGRIQKIFSIHSSAELHGEHALTAHVAKWRHGPRIMKRLADTILRIRPRHIRALIGTVLYILSFCYRSVLVNKDTSSFTKNTAV